MARFFTADLHLGHSNIIDYSSRPFRDAEEMNDALIERSPSGYPADPCLIDL